MSKYDDFDFSIIAQMNYRDKVELSKKLAKVANTRISTLEKTGKHSFAKDKADKFLQEHGRTKFYEGSKFENEFRLNRQLAVLQDFITSKSSTITGLKKIQVKALEKFEDKGYHINDADSFFNFLSSQQFQQLRKYVDSEQVIEDYTQAVDDGFTDAQIFKQYEKFMNSEYTFDEVQRKRERALRAHKLYKQRKK